VIALQPVGLGTPFVESLTSLVRRTAEHEVRKIQTLLNLVFPASERDRIAAIAIGEGTNAAGARTAVLVNAFTLATGNADVIRTSFLSIGDDLWLQHGFRNTRAWCPACLEDNDAGQLLWSLDHVTACVRHGLELQTTCHRCGREHRPWHRLATALTCPCSADLRRGPRTGVAFSPLQRASVEMVEHMQSGLPFPVDRIAAGARHLVQSRPELAKRVPELSRLVSGRVRPQFLTLAKILATAGCSPHEMLGHGSVIPVQRTSARARCSRHELRPIEKRLRRELALLVDQRATPYEIAESVGMRPATLRVHFPALMEVLTTEWRDMRRRRSIAKAERNVALVLDRAEVRLADGLPVSGSAIARDLGRRNLTLLKDERRALDDLLAKLG
jgi:hypothetical protein